MLSVGFVTVTGINEAIKTARAYYGNQSQSDSMEVTTIDSRRNDWGILGASDLSLLKSSVIRGPTYNKFLDLIRVTLQVTAPMYWWSSVTEVMRPLSIPFSPDPTKGVVKAKLNKPLQVSDFSIDHMDEEVKELFLLQLEMLNQIRLELVDRRKNKSRTVEEFMAILPMSYNVTDTIQMTYNEVIELLRNPNIANMYEDWSTFIQELRKLPYIETLLNCLAFV